MPSHAGAAYRPYAVVQQWRLPELPFDWFVRSVHHSLPVAHRKAKANRDACTWLWNNWSPWFVWHIIDRRSGEVLHTYH